MVGSQDHLSEQFPEWNMKLSRDFSKANVLEINDILNEALKKISHCSLDENSLLF